jgi:hypothetical protein
MEAVKLIWPAEMHLAREGRVIAQDREVMGEGRDLGHEFSSIVPSSDLRREAASHEGIPRWRAERIIAISGIEHDRCLRERRQGWHLYHLVAIDLENGKLIAPFATKIKSAESFYLVERAGERLPRTARLFRDWILTEAARFGS